jgi:activating signal cointegrator 1
VKALSLTQPWATLVATGEKRIETRSWSTGYRGWIAIHASKGFPRWAREYAEDLEFQAALKRHGYSIESLPLGCIVAVCKLRACIRTEHCPEVFAHTIWNNQEKLFGDYSLGRWGWALDDPHRLPEPIPVKGSLGLWDVPQHVSRAIGEQLGVLFGDGHEAWHTASGGSIEQC